MDELQRLALAVLLPGLSRPTLDAGLVDLLDAGLGGLCLFGTAATAPPEELRSLLARAHGLAAGLVVAIDEEGGDVTRLHAATGSPSPGNAVLGAVDDPAATRRAALAIGTELAGLGITLDLGPVADVNAAADNPVIGVRSFSADPAVAARHTGAWVTGLQQAGVSACAKHFPGHGSTSADSHLTLPVVPDDAAAIAARDLPPFRAAVAAGVDAVMTSHLLLPRLDPDRPATFSPVVLRVLREDLGFTGTIVSDALDMAGASAGRGIPAAAVAALAAGVDLLCLSADTPQDLGPARWHRGRSVRPLPRARPAVRPQRPPGRAGAGAGRGPLHRLRGHHGCHARVGPSGRGRVRVAHHPGDADRAHPGRLHGDNGSAGRPAARAGVAGVRDPGMVRFGLDIGGTKTLGVAVDSGARVLAEARQPTRPGADGVVHTALEVIATLQERVGSAPTTVGVGVPGVVETGSGVVRHPVNLGLAEPELALGAALTAALGRPVVVENDVNAAALGALAWLSLDTRSAVRDLAYLSLGTGVAAGIILAGRLRRGATGSAGEIGHLPIAAGPACRCGQHGCIETVASGRALASAWPTPGGHALPALLAAVAAGDAAALGVWERFTDGVAAALRIAALSVDPEWFVVGGGLAGVGQPLLAGITAALSRQAAGSQFLAGVGIAARTVLVPPGLQVGALGAALAGATD